MRNSVGSKENEKTSHSSSGSSIAKSAILVTIMMLSFKIVGFIKQAVIAAYYGASLATDVYFIAWGFISGVSEAIIKALSVSIVAVYTSIRVEKGKEKANDLINGLLETLVPVFLLIVTVINIGSTVFSKMLAPTFDQVTNSQLILYIRILSPVMLFSSVELILGSVLDSYKSFFVPRLQSFIYSVITIAFCVLFSRKIGINALLYSQYLSYFIFTFLVVTSAKKYHTFYAKSITDVPEIREILITAIPLFIGNSALQLNQIVDKSITSSLGNGFTSALTYCHTLEQFVTNIMIVNLGNVMFANFAEFAAKKDIKRVSDTLSKTLDLLIMILIAVSVITFTCAEDIVKIVYYRGSFNYESVELTAKALKGYSVSFVMVAVRDLSIKSLYAFKDTKHPMLASIVSICINIPLSFVLSHYFGIFGVSMSTSISAIVGMFVNTYCLKKYYLKNYHFELHLNTFVKCIPAGVVLLVFCCIILNCVNMNSIFSFLCCSIFGFIIYFGIIYLTRVEEFQYYFMLGKSYLKRIVNNN